MLRDYPERAARCVRVRFADPPGPLQVAWFCDTHAGLGLKYAGQPTELAWLAIWTTVGIVRKNWPRERGPGADAR